MQDPATATTPTYGPTSTTFVVPGADAPGWHVVVTYTTWHDAYLWEISYARAGDEPLTQRYVINENGSVTTWRSHIPNGTATDITVHAPTPPSITGADALLLEHTADLLQLHDTTDLATPGALVDAIYAAAEHLGMAIYSVDVTRDVAAVHLRSTEDGPRDVAAGRALLEALGIEQPRVQEPAPRGGEPPYAWVYVSGSSPALCLDVECVVDL